MQVNNDFTHMVVDVHESRSSSDNLENDNLTT